MNNNKRMPTYKALPMVADNTRIMTLMYLRLLINLVTLNTLNILKALKALKPLLSPLFKKYSIKLMVTKHASNIFILSRI